MCSGFILSIRMKNREKAQNAKKSEIWKKPSVKIAIFIHSENILHIIPQPWQVGCHLRLLIMEIISLNVPFLTLASAAHK